MANPVTDMATVGRVAGARIDIFLKDHDPPHVHVWYQGSRAKLDIASGAVLATGKHGIPPNVLSAVQAWMAANRYQLQQEWQAAKSGKTPNLIP